MGITAPEKGPSLSASVETQKLIVRQPVKLAELGKLLDTLDNLNARVSETQGKGPASDWSGGASSGAGAGQGDDDSVSPRDKAIAAMPPPLAVRQRLEQHIEKEVKKLEREAKWISASAKPGSAFRLNEVYTRIRKLNSLLRHLFEAAEDVLKRMYIRVFIDGQSIL